MNLSKPDGINNVVLCVAGALIAALIVIGFLFIDPASIDDFKFTVIFVALILAMGWDRS